MIRARAQEGQKNNQQTKSDLLEQQTQIDSKLQTPLELRIENEIGAEEYAAERAELHERQSAVRLQLEVSDHDASGIADRAIAAFELSLSLIA